MAILGAGLLAPSQTPCRRHELGCITYAPLRRLLPGLRISGAQGTTRRTVSTLAAPADGASAPAPTTTTSSAPSPTASKSDAYSGAMQRQMGTSLTYRHEEGLNYNRILPDLIVGSCLQTPADVDLLAEREGVTTVFCLQEDSDMEYFSLDIRPIQARCAERGDIKHVRFPIRDFDPFDLRRKLPKAVTRLAREHNPTTGTVYIHCTAGLGRAPATALAYMFWLRGFQLDAGYELLRGKRLCSPRIEAIRSATVDLLVGSEPVSATIAVYRTGTATDWKIAGLDVGWHQQLPLQREEGATGRMVLRRALQPGKYPYKFIVDGHWTYSADHPTVQDGNNINNVLEVMGRSLPPELCAAQERLLSPGGDLTQDERQHLGELLCPWATHL
ncbi:hypothetical protein Agub_g2722 [Astrephomene gubernaculifera]|uniref:Uncharacterized protein n=1 Tax=Astrephomene gubernaculifera TaxID=47775 RepID=A0AAD3HHW5_9CHLO|nr:hypothetical protein Agub_g2722 [Astrephomene gubernaculifera]